MPEKRVKFQMPGLGEVEGTEISVREPTDRWSEVTLEDDTKLRVKPNVIAAIRVDGQWDNEGNPVYALKTNQIVTVESAQPMHQKPPSDAPVV